MRTDIFTSPTEKTADRHRPVGVDAPLRFATASCLPVRFPEQTCGLCASACPTQVIDLIADGLRLNEGCIGCGQCAATCPTGALSVDGFALPVTLPPSDAPIHVDCWRVPFAESPPGALRVPCLAGISAGWLLALFDLAAASGERSIVLLDRSACGGCTASAGMADLHATLDEVVVWLLACGVAEERLPRFVTQAARGPLAPNIPTSAGEVRIDRRGFFRGLMGGVARGAEQIAAVQFGADDPTDRPIVLRETVAPLERMRIVAALTAIAARHHREVPAQALPHLSLADCSAHGVCAHVCPTGALVREEQDDTAELKFFAARCIACGQCARVCPDRALRVAATGGTAVVAVLARWQAHECTACGETFFGAGETCPGCSKHQQLFQGMAALFRPSA